MKKYEFLDHTADAKFLAYGKTLEEAFENAALATFALITDVEKVQSKISHKIDITAKHKRSLLYDLIDQLIFLTDTEGFLLSEATFNIKQNEDTTFTLKGEVKGDKADNYEVFSAVKAPTYSDMFIKEEQSLVTIQMVPDI